MGCEPSKTWTANDIRAAMAEKRRPGQRHGGSKAGNLRLISAAVSLGIVTREQAKGRSLWNAETVAAFVVKHKLHARITVNPAE
jgi:hypothetical protein